MSLRGLRPDSFRGPPDLRKSDEKLPRLTKAGRTPGSRLSSPSYQSITIEKQMKMKKYIACSKGSKIRAFVAQWIDKTPVRSGKLGTLKKTDLTPLWSKFGEVQENMPVF